MRLLFSTGPGYGLLMPMVPLMWAARSAGHEIVLATTAYVVGIAASCGLPAVDVFPERDVGADLMRAASGDIPTPGDADHDCCPEGYWDLAREQRPFELFAMAMAGGTVDAGRKLSIDACVYTEDHLAGEIAATVLGVPSLQVGNRVTWSKRDDSDLGDDSRLGADTANTDLGRTLRARHNVTDQRPDLVAKVDPRPVSFGGLLDFPAEGLDLIPWWPMQYVPYNGGAVLPSWLLAPKARRRVCLTLGTVAPLLSDGSLMRALVQSLTKLNVDVVLADHSTDTSALGALPANVVHLGYLPLSTILPTCDLVVHHGGSGTTAAALHYAVPQLIIPCGADNPMAAEQVERTGVGTWIDPGEVTDTAVRQICAKLLDDPIYRSRAESISWEMARQPSPGEVLGRFVEHADSPR